MEPDSLRATAAKVPLKPKAAWNAHGALIRAATEIERLRACLHGQAGSLAKAYRDVEKWKRAALLADDRRSATARRERDEALGVVRDWLGVRDELGMGDDDSGLAPVVKRARALVAGQPPPAQRGAEIERLKEERDRLALSLKNYRTSFSRLERQRDALRRHALKLDGLCERAAVLLGALGRDDHQLVRAIRSRGEVPR